MVEVLPEYARHAVQRDRIDARVEKTVGRVLEMGLSDCEWVLGWFNGNAFMGNMRTRNLVNGSLNGILLLISITPIY